MKAEYRHCAGTLGSTELTDALISLRSALFKLPYNGRRELNLTLLGCRLRTRPYIYIYYIYTYARVRERTHAALGRDAGSNQGPAVSTQGW